MFQLYDSGLEFQQIGRNLWEQGFKHYDKPFSYHAVEVILGNSVYIGMPAWGKIGVGAYRILHGGEPTKIKRKASDTLVVRKDESQYVRSLKPVFPPIVPVELWQRVHDRLRAREHTNPNYGKRRTRRKATHPLNGKLVCPDCDQPMVLGSSMPALGARGKRTRCFNCGTYRRFSRLQCHANTVGWDRLDFAIEMLLETVKGRIDRFTSDPVKALQKESWSKGCEFTQLLDSISEELETGTAEELAEYRKPPASPDTVILDVVFETYNRVHARKTHQLRQELNVIDGELTRIGTLLMEGLPSQTIKKQLFDRMAELEGRKGTIEPQLIPLTVRAETIAEQMESIRRTIEDSEKVMWARLLDSFIAKVVPRFDVDHVGPNRRRRAVLRSIEFIPRESDAARTVLPQVMEISAIRRDRDSSPRPG
jgi:hypothetical protein